MQLLLHLSDFIVPLVILGIVMLGLSRNVCVYDEFIKGAVNGFMTVIKIMPTLIGLMVAVGILRASGFLEFIGKLIGRFTSYIGFPGELVPLTIVRMFSSSASTGLVLDIFKQYGTDSHIGLIASIMMSLHGNYFLYDERLFYGGKGKKDKVYTTGCAGCHICGNCGKCDTCRDDVRGREFPCFRLCI